MTELKPQLTGEEVAQLSPEEISEAHGEGRLDDYLQTKRQRGTTPEPPAADADQGARGRQPTSPTDGKSAEEIVELLEQGSLNSYLGEPRRRRSSVT